MLKRYAAFISFFRSVCDICVTSFIWIFVFYLRFHSGIFVTTKGIPDFKKHLLLTLPVVLICYLCCFFAGLYKAKRTQNMFAQILDIFKTSFLSGLFVLAFFYYLRDLPYSRKLLVLFMVLLFIGLVFSHVFTMALVRRFRRKGYNLRHCVIIGTGQKGQQLFQDIEKTGWLGLKCAFFIDFDPVSIGSKLFGVPVYGPCEKLPELIKTKNIDEVYLTLDGNQAQKVYPVLKTLQSTGITIRIIPDWGELISISDANIITIGSQVLFSAADSPLSGFNAILKEIFDRLIALFLLAIFIVPMGIIALLIKLTSRGPIFYKQVRVGMDQKEFHILKFRTMAADEQNKNGAQWTTLQDPRRTPLGKWLRKTSLDELPQLINVLRGQMSLVGPRPEQPYFVKEFSEEYKNYMLRHKVKAGMTGLAQINGFRGDTSIRKRLLYDLYYVRNWSFVLDLWILLRTPWNIIKGSNAY